MIPQISTRRIGTVTIVDVKGSFTGTWAVREGNELAYNVSHERDRTVILNLQLVDSLDSIGARTLLDSFPRTRSLSILRGNQGVMEIMNRYLGGKRIKVFCDENDAVSDLAEEMVTRSYVEDRRRRYRFKTALPLQFHYDDDGSRVEFNAVVTNLNEQGLHAEYIDLKVAEQSLEQLTPYDLKMLHLEIAFPSGIKVRALGHVVHRRLYGDQVGIGVEFKKIGPKEVAVIRRFIKGQES